MWRAWWVAMDEWHYYKTFNEYYPNSGYFGSEFLGSLGLSNTMYVTPNGEMTHRSYDYDFTSAWSVASSQYKYFSDPKNGYISGAVIKVSNKQQIASAVNNLGVQPGDLLYFENSEGIHHTAMISGVDYGDNPEIRYAAHTKNRDYQELSSALKDDSIYIVRLK
jgi:plastocyanin